MPYTHRQLVIVYEAPEDENVLAPARLERIRQIEDQFKALPGYEDLCGRFRPESFEPFGAGCMPGESLAAWLWP